MLLLAMSDAWTVRKVKCGIHSLIEDVKIYEHTEPRATALGLLLEL